MEGMLVENMIFVNDIF
jgi:hypothetical protein